MAARRRPAAGAGADTDDTTARHARLDALLQRRLAPALPELAAMQRRYRTRGLAALLASCLLLVLVLAAGAEGLVIFPAVGLAFAIGVLIHLARRFRDTVRGTLTPLVAEAIGDISHRVGEAEAVMTRLRRLPLVVPCGHETIDDVFSGRHAGTEFTMIELRMFNRTRSTSGSGASRTSVTTDRTVFRGLVFMIATPVLMPARIVVRGRRGWFTGRWRLGDKAMRAAGYAPVAVPDAAFARRLALWADDPAKALEIVGPALATTFAQLAATAGRGGIDAGFIASNFLLLLPRSGDAFAPGGLFRPLSRLPAEAHALMQEILVVHRLIDALKGN
jgi:hypothetical protein